MPSESIHHKTLNRLTQQFLHVFLVGHGNLSLPEASDKIHGSTSTMTDLAKLGGWDGIDDGTGLSLHKAASKGLKTKIRRLYDVSNVLHHMNWILKMSPAIHQPKFTNDIAPLLLERRPQYKWNYIPIQEIRAAYLRANGKESSSSNNNTASKSSHESMFHSQSSMSTSSSSSSSGPAHTDYHGYSRRVSLEDDQLPQHENISRGLFSSHRMSMDMVGHNNMGV